MTKMISISLPVVDIKASKAFYEALGFTSNAAFTGDSAACMVWSEAIVVMLLTHDMWKTRTTRPIPPPTHSEVALGLTLDSRAAVDAMIAAAAAHGGIADVNPVEDLDGIYGRDLADPDGHVWGAMWMDAAAPPSSG